MHPAIAKPFFPQPCALTWVFDLLSKFLQIVILNCSLGINIIFQTTPIWEILIFHSAELLFLQWVTDETIE